MAGIWKALADAIVGMHYAFLGYVLVGGLLAWRWHWTIVPHLLAAVWAVLIVTTRVPCPLTALQNNLRERAGQVPIGDSFVNTYVRGRFYPAHYEGLAQLLLGVIVLASWIGYGWRDRRRRRRLGRVAG